MIFSQLTIKDFRCFYGRQELHFSRGETANVTLIHAENGFGKTTLLNAFIWCLYGNLTLDSERKKEIINSRAWDEDGSRAEALVELQFEHEDIKYIVTRSVGIDGKTDLALMESDPHRTAGLRRRDNPVEVIHSILPEAMYNYFFFNGERINYLASENSKNEVKDAIKTILGLELLERAMKELTSVKKHYSREIEKHGTEEAKNLKRSEDRLQEELGDLKRCHKDHTENLRVAKDILARVEEKLRKNQQSRELQIRRDEVRKRLEYVERSIAEAKTSIYRLCSSDGYWLLLKPLLEDAELVLNDVRTTKQLPALYRDTFINDLLAEKQCICDRGLVPDSDHYNAVRSLLEKSSDDQMDQGYLSCISTKNAFDQRKTEVSNTLVRSFQALAQFQEETLSLEEELSEISSEIGDSDEVTDYEAERNQVSEKITNLQIQAQQTKGQISAKEAEIEQIVNELKKVEKLESLAKQAQDRYILVSNSIDFISKQLKFFIEYTHEELLTSMNKYFSTMCNKEYRITLTQDFKLQVLGRRHRDSDEWDPIPKSTGENQITSLAFLGGLVELAGSPERLKIPMSVGGGHYPIVMDSPFGTLDNDYRKGIAQWVPTVAKQVIVLVSSTQYQYQVEESMAPFVGRRYVLAFHGTKPKKETPETIDIDGAKFVQFVESDGYNYTRIFEVGADR
jgi:DNA sulfur modification protein DndD